MRFACARDSNHEIRPDAFSSNLHTKLIVQNLTIRFSGRYNPANHRGPVGLYNWGLLEMGDIEDG
jgi:hypothetical protein